MERGVLETTIPCAILSDIAFHVTDDSPQYGGPKAEVIIPAVTRSIDSMEKMSRVIIDPDEYLAACGLWQPITDKHEKIQGMRLTLVSEALARMVHGKDTDGLTQFAACLPGEGSAQARAIQAVEDALHGNKERKSGILTSGLNYQACYRAYAGRADGNEGIRALNGVQACLFLNHQYVLHIINQADQEKLRAFLSSYLVGPDFAAIEEAKNRFLLEAAGGLERQLEQYAQAAETGGGSEVRQGFEGAGAPYRDFAARAAAIRKGAEAALQRKPDRALAIAVEGSHQTRG